MSWWEGGEWKIGAVEELAAKHNRFNFSISSLTDFGSFLSTLTLAKLQKKMGEGRTQLKFIFPVSSYYIPFAKYSAFWDGMHIFAKLISSSNVRKSIPIQFLICYLRQELFTSQSREEMEPVRWIIILGPLRLWQWFNDLRSSCCTVFLYCCQRLVLYLNNLFTLWRALSNQTVPYQALTKKTRKEQLQSLKKWKWFSWSPHLIPKSSSSHQPGPFEHFLFH